MFLLRTVLLFLILNCSRYKFANTLPAIPDNVRIDSEVATLKNREFQLYTVEEFIDRRDGSIQIRAKDEFPLPPHESFVVNYYRIKEATKGTNFGNSVVLYNHQSVCQPINIAYWLLKDMTKTLSMLYESPDLNLGDFKDDRTAIGPTTLLRIFYANANLLKLTMKAYDVVRSTEMYYFQTVVSLKNNQVAKLICLIPVATVMDDVNVVVGKTLLSELKTQYHPAVLSVVIFDKGDTRVEKSPQDLYDVSNDETDKLVVAYYLIQERSLGKHLGLKYGRLDEKNPFTLPKGGGCGSQASHEIFFVSAKQFSGIYETPSSNSRYYIAYDDATNHLRIDSIGEYKMIYDLNERRVTYIGDPDYFIDDGHNEHSSNEDKTHCSQSPIMQVDDEGGLYKVRSIEEVLGTDKSVGLSYLGTAMLDDGTHCLMFEREISYARIPIILKMNMALEVHKSDRIFIVYYFVDDLLISTKGNDFFNDLTSYQSMWLKRIELMSVNMLSVSVLNAQVTFSEFTWSLESISEDTRDRESKIFHPARTFDTSECKSIHDQTKLEFLIKEVDKSVFDGKKAEPSWDRNRMTEVSKQIESFEEAMIVFLSKQTRISRSLINKFELIDATEQQSKLENSERKLFLVRANLIMPMNYNFDKTLIGWIESIDSIPFEKYGKFVKNARSMSRNECSLYLATLFYNSNKINMVYCPNVGCAYVDDIKSIKYVEKDPSNREVPISVTFNTCEIYVQTKVVDSSKIIGDRFTSNSIEKSLNGSQILFDIQSQQDQNDESNSNTFRGLVIKTALIKGLSLDYLGHPIRYGLCFTTNTDFRQQQQQDKPFGLDITVLKLEQPHSLIYCHKACHLDANCQTYSYSKNSNECIITNIPSKYFSEPNIDGSIDLMGLQENKDCNLYKPNSLHLYQTSKIVMLNSVSSLESPYNSNKRYYITVAKLPDCATLCHSNELNVAKMIQCQKFIYFPINSICVIEDQQWYLLETRDKISNINSVDKTKHFMEIVGKENWFKINQYHEYYRDYSQYYIIRDWTKIEQSEEEREKVRNEQEMDSKNVNHDAENEIHDITGELTLYSLDKEDCLRECTIINPNCVMVDYCFNNLKGMTTRYCSMYTVRSPMLINSMKLEPEAREKQDISSDSTPLNELERRYYRPNNFKLSAIREYGCTHYYLAGDNLALKRQLAEAHLNSHQGNLAVMDELANEDRESSHEFLESIKQLMRPTAMAISLSQILSSLMFGVLSGCIISLIISTSMSSGLPIHTISWRVIDWFNEYRHKRFGRTQRSCSQVVLDVELRDMRGEEEETK